jgi:hypothetical protein
MPRPPRWTKGGVVDGVIEVELASWKYFHDFVRQELLEYPQYVWRGQRDAAWELESSFDRTLTPKQVRTRRAIATRHLAKFKLATRGRRGATPSKITDDNEWWALGQHDGLATPLLDWTESPFVALYFAHEKPLRPASGQRAVWALGSVAAKNKEIREGHLGSTRPPLLEFVRPQLDESARLVSQAGLFTRAPFGQTVDGWVRDHFSGKTRGAALIKISIPELGRTECLRTLNKMNINHLSLFPDVYGAAQHCNTALRIDKY